MPTTSPLSLLLHMVIIHYVLHYCLPSVALLSSRPQHPEPSYKLFLNMSHVPLLLQVFHLNTQWNSQHYAVLKPVCCAIFHSVCTAHSAQQGGVIQYFQRFSKSNTFLLIRYIFKRSNPKNWKLWPRKCACGTVFILKKNKDLENLYFFFLAETTIAKQLIQLIQHNKIKFF